MSVKEQLHTIRDFIRYSCTRLNQSDVYLGHGTDLVWDEAVQLVLLAAGLPINIDSSVMDARLLSEEKDRVLKWLDKRVNERVPLPYITGEAWFCNMPFYVDERVLIPRSPIAELIEQDFQPWLVEEALPEQAVGRVLDLCTGSACIAIALAYAFDDAEVVATELSEDALHVAYQNVVRHGVEHQVQLLQGDLFAEAQGKFDLIVSNPPYVDAEDMASLPNEYQHEPELALASGEDGLDITRRILSGAKSYLNPGGLLVVEVGNSWPALVEAYPEIPFIWLDFERGGDGVFALRYEDLPE